MWNRLMVFEIKCTQRASAVRPRPRGPAHGHTFAREDAGAPLYAFNFQRPLVRSTISLSNRLSPFDGFTRLGFEKFTAWIARKRFITDDQILWHFEIGQELLGKGDDVRFFELLSGPRHDDGADLLTHHLVGHADDSDLEDRRMRSKCIFDLNAIDVLAAAIDHIFLSIDDVDQTLLVDSGHIAGVEPSVDEGIGRRFGFIPVALHDIRSANEQFADAADRISFK